MVGRAGAVLAAALALAGCAAASARPRPIPLARAAAVARAFHAKMTPEEVAHTGVMRRGPDGRWLACLTGANLNCGKADTSRTNRGASWWCRHHPGAPFVPLFASGHASIYAWGCRGRRAVIARQVQRVDAQGYVAGAWRAIP